MFSKNVFENAIPHRNYERLNPEEYQYVEM
jgi:hypothetical protein